MTAGGKPARNLTESRRCRSLERIVDSEEKPLIADGSRQRPGRNERVMPFKSQAQRRKFAELLVEGKISAETFEEWNRETGRKKLPERVNRKSTKRKATKKK